MFLPPHRNPPLPDCTYLCAIHLEFASLNSYEPQVRHMFMALFSETRNHLVFIIQCVLDAWVFCCTLFDAK